MKVFAILVILAVGAYAADDFCSMDVNRACKSTKTKHVSSLANCNARYGAIDGIVSDLQSYVSTHVTRSYEYLLMSTHYASYLKSRAGFEKLFRELSDSKWKQSIELIKYITKRGGEMKFEERVEEGTAEAAGNYEVYELESLAKALEIEKDLAEEAHHIHGEATRRRENYHDPEVSSYLENEFVHKHSESIRKLSGYTNDLINLLKGPDGSLSLFLFDEYLQKQ